MTAANPPSPESEPARSEIERVCAALRGVESLEVWALAPHISQTRGHVNEPRQSRPAQIGRGAARGFVRRAGPELFRVGPILFVSSSQQQMRVLAPLGAELSRRFGPLVPVQMPRLAPLEVVRCLRRGHEAAQSIDAALGELGRHTHAALLEDSINVAVANQRAVRMFERGEVSVVVVASQHNPAVRAVLAAALGQPRVRTAYLPHAPVASNVAYLDLPVHLAMLRGESEVGYYRSIPGCGENLAIVGDPSVSADASRAPNPAPVVLAGPGPAAGGSRFRFMVETVEASGIGPVEVVLHPRSPRDVERGVIPNDWHISEFVRTLDVLSTTGASVVIQSSSGTGLEALGMGVPVIDLCEPGTAPAYPFIAPPHVMVVSDSSQLRAAADHMDQSESAAQARKEYARSWVALVGDDASVAAADAVAHELAEGAGPLVLDAWQSIRPSLP